MNTTKDLAEKGFCLEVNGDNFAAEGLNSDKPVLVDFWASWCGPCRAIAPVIESLALQFSGKVKVTKVNVDENPELSAQYQVRSIPTLLIFKDGAVVDGVIG